LIECDVLIIGGGSAGLACALSLPDTVSVVIAAKSAVEQCNSFQAQGGIAAVTDPEDSFASHIEDTLEAGSRLNDPEVVRFIVEQAPAAIAFLVQAGVTFTLCSGEADCTTGFHLTREGGHSRRRILHAADATGAAIMSALTAQAKQRPNTRYLASHMAIDLMTDAKLRGLEPGSRGACRGAYLLDEELGQVVTVSARAVVLATGGAGKVYLYTSNPDTATGDGIAIAHRAGAQVRDMEFFQFHPTCLYHPEAKNFLISEAVRGEGGILVDRRGKRFMDRYHPKGELAPRDIVARAIDAEMKRSGQECVYLDIRHKGEAFIESHFPTIRRRCLEMGIDIVNEPIPVVPAAHYLCGGVATDIRARTSVDALYAVGETARTGLHGANRLASNSLLECVVMGRAAAEDIARRLRSETLPKLRRLPEWDTTGTTDPDERVVITHNWQEIRRAMWDYVGIVRTAKRMKRARQRIDLIEREIAEYYWDFTVDRDLLELRNLTVVARLITQGGQNRPNSIGLHWMAGSPPPTDTP